MSLPFAKLCSFQSLISREQERTITAKKILVDKRPLVWLVCRFWKNRYQLFNSHPDHLILTNGKHPLPLIDSTNPIRLSLHTGQVAHQARAYPGFCSMKRLGVFLLPPG